MICVFNPELLAGQLQGIKHNLNKTLKELAELKTKLLEQKTNAKRGRKPTAASTEKNVRKIISRQFIKSLIRWDITETKAGIDLSFEFDEQAFQKLKETCPPCLGKTLQNPRGGD